MNQVLDRKRQRRAYLRKKGTAYAVATVSSVVLLCSLFVAAFIICWSVWLEMELHGAFMLPLLKRVTNVSTIVAVCGVISYVCWRVAKKARKTANSLPYVLPVTSGTLSAEEVLVRGAQEPSAPSETLLRATVKDEDTKAEELLRVAASGTGVWDR